MQLTRENSHLLNMGTAFDAVLPQTETRYYEKKIEQGTNLSSQEREILQNRRLLHNVMARAGFSNYLEEWWHFDCRNQFDASRTGKPALYGAAQFSPECSEWEKMRINHYQGSLKWRQNPSRILDGPKDELTQIVCDAALRYGHLGLTRHNTAMRLQV